MVLDKLEERLNLSFVRSTFVIFRAFSKIYFVELFFALRFKLIIVIKCLAIVFRFFCVKASIAKVSCMCGVLKAVEGYFRNILSEFESKRCNNISRSLLNIIVNNNWARCTQSEIKNSCEIDFHHGKKSKQSWLNLKRHLSRDDDTFWCRFMCSTLNANKIHHRKPKRKFLKPFRKQTLIRFCEWKIWQ